MSNADKDETLAAWLASFYEPDDVPDDECDEPTVRWLRGYFEAHGAAPRDVVERDLVAYLVALAEDAVAATLHDLETATSLRPSVAVEIHDEISVRIVINGGYTAPSMWAFDRPEAFAEVADYFQEQLDQSGAGAWPVCDRHDLGLHAEVRDEWQSGGAASSSTLLPRSEVSERRVEGAGGPSADSGGSCGVGSLSGDGKFDAISLR